MIREIVEIAEDTITLKLPEDLVGKKVEGIAFEIEEAKINTEAEIFDREQRLKDIRERYAQLPRISHKNYKFDRDEANDHE